MTTTDKFTNISIAVFLVTYVGLYYAEYLVFVWIGYLLLGSAIILNILQKRRCARSGLIFIGITIIFVLLAYFSSIWSYDYDETLNAASQLLKTVVIILLMVSLINNEQRLRIALFWLSVGSVIYGLLYLQHVDLSTLGSDRLSYSTFDSSDSDNLPNYNVVSMYVAYAAVYFTWLIVDNQTSKYKILNIAFLIAAVVAVFIFGSRKSILMMALGVLYFLFGPRAKSSVRIKLFILVFSSILIALTILPETYVNYIFSRFDNIFGGSGKIELDGSDMIRMEMINDGLSWFWEKPILGNGFYSFPSLFGNKTGLFMYAHNNYVELLCDLGIIGFILFYYPIIRPIVVGRRILKYSPLTSVLFILGLLNILGSMFIVTYLDRTSWLLSSSIFVGINMEYIRIKSLNKL